MTPLLATCFGLHRCLAAANTYFICVVISTLMLMVILVLGDTARMLICAF